MSVEGWTSQILRDLATINYGKSPAEILSSEGSYPVVGTGGTDRLGTNFLYEGDSIILGRKGTIDRVYFTTGKFWIIDTAYYLNEFIETYPLWLFYFLQTIDLRQMNEATGVPSLSRDALYTIKVQTPSLKEQEKIADILSNIDRAITQTEAIIAKQQRIKTGLMQDLLTKGIDENGNIRSEATHEFKDSSIGHIPVEWEVVTIAEIVNAVDPQPDHRTPPEVADGVPYIGISDFQKDGTIDFDNARKVSLQALIKQRKAFSINEGDFVFGKIGTIGLPRRIPNLDNYALSANVILLKPKETPLFVYWWMVSPIVERMVDIEIHTTSQPAFGIKKIRSLKISKPRPEEQIKIVNLLEKADDKIKEYEKNLSKLRSLKTGLMQDLLTGKVRVTPLLEKE